MANSVRFTASVDDKVSSSLSKIRDNFDRLGKGAASASLAGNVGAKLLGVGMGLVSEAANHAVQFLGDATQAALEEEASTAKLSTSLRANIPNWDGNTAAIEKVMAAQMALGFSDEDQRNSLTLLAAATHDVGKAQDIQRTAMDLARFKGISLADATEALTRVEAGSYRILKSLGIELKTGATQTEALAAVQRVAAGQAEDYANTNAGKLLVSQVKVGEAMEKFGAVTMPIVVAVTQAAADQISKLGDDVGGLTKSLNESNAPAGDLWKILNTPLDLTKLDLSHLRWEDVFVGWDVAATTTGTTVGKLGDDVEHFQRSVVGNLGTVAKSSLELAADFDTTQRRIRAADDLTVKQLTKNANDLIDKAFDPEIAHEKLIATNAEIAADKRILASSKSTAAEKADARSALADLDKTQAQYLITLATTGDTTSKAYKTGVANLKTEIAKATGPTKTYLQGILDQLNGIDSVNATPTVTVKVYGGAALTALATKLGYVGNTDIYKKKYVPPIHGAGGWVGLNGPELGILGDKGPEYVIPHDKLPTGQSPTGSVSLGRSGMGGSSGSTVVNVIFNSTFPPTASEGQRLAKALVPELTREMRRQAVL